MPVSTGFLFSKNCLGVLRKAFIWSKPTAWGIQLWGWSIKGCIVQNCSWFLFFPPTSWLSLERACWQRSFPSDLEKFSQMTFMFRKKPDRTENLSPLYQVHNTCLHLEPISSGVRYRRNDIKFLLFMARWVLQFWPLLKETLLCGDGVGTLEGFCREGTGLMQGHHLEVKPSVFFYDSWSQKYHRVWFQQQGFQEQ